MTPTAAKSGHFGFRPHIARRSSPSPSVVDSGRGCAGCLPRAAHTEGTNTHASGSRGPAEAAGAWLRSGLCEAAADLTEPARTGQARSAVTARSGPAPGIALKPAFPPRRRAALPIPTVVRLDVAKAHEVSRAASAQPRTHEHQYYTLNKVRMAKTSSQRTTPAIESSTVCN